MDHDNTALPEHIQRDGHHAAGGHGRFVPGGVVGVAGGRSLPHLRLIIRDAAMSAACRSNGAGVAA